FRNGGRPTHAAPTLARIGEREWEPFAADRRLAARTRSVRRYKCSAGQQVLPSAPDFNQVVTVCAIAVQKDHQLFRGARAWFEPRAIEFSHSSFSFSSPFCWLSFSVGYSPEPASPRVSSRHANIPIPDLP